MIMPRKLTSGEINDTRNAIVSTGWKRAPAKNTIKSRTQTAKTGAGHLKNIRGKSKTTKKGNMKAYAEAKEKNRQLKTTSSFNFSSFSSFILLPSLYTNYGHNKNIFDGAVKIMVKGGGSVHGRGLLAK